MQKNMLLLSLFASTILLADSAPSALQKQLKKQEKTIQTLISRVNMLESQVPKRINSFSSFSQSAFLPDIAFILNMSGVSRNVNNSEYEKLEIPGLISKGDNGLIFNQNRGFNLNYAEVSMHSDVGPYFGAYVVFHLQSETFEIEEAFVKTTALPYGISIKAGKFKSAFGRLNSQHQHSWNFDEQPIVLNSFFGADSVKDAGIQVQWIAPTDTYLMIGLEALQGTNPRSFGNTEGNSLYTGYVKSSIDIGEDISLLGGVSYFKGKNAESKSTEIYGLDFTFRNQLGSYSSLVWQSEYLMRDSIEGNREKKQDGFYTQLMYQYNNNYSTAIRYDGILRNDADLSVYNYNGVNTDDLVRYTAMLEYKPFEMTRFRVSYSYDKSKIISGQRKDINTLMLTLNIAAGAHGAHEY